MNCRSGWLRVCILYDSLVGEDWAWDVLVCDVCLCVTGVCFVLFCFDCRRVRVCGTFMIAGVRDRTCAWCRVAAAVGRGGAERGRSSTSMHYGKRPEQPAEAAGAAAASGTIRQYFGCRRVRIILAGVDPLPSSALQSSHTHTHARTRTQTLVYIYTCVPPRTIRPLHIHTPAAFNVPPLLVVAKACRRHFCP